MAKASRNMCCLTYSLNVCNFSVAASARCQRQDVCCAHQDAGVSAVSVDEDDDRPGWVSKWQIDGRASAPVDTLEDDDVVRSAMCIMTPLMMPVRVTQRLTVVSAAATVRRGEELQLSKNFTEQQQLLCHRRRLQQLWIQPWICNRICLLLLMLLLQQWRGDGCGGPPQAAAAACCSCYWAALRHSDLLLLLLRLLLQLFL